MTMLSERQQLSYIASQAADARLNVELETEGMTLNIGPQHPATHGTLRIIARLDGEQVVWAEPSAGYMHRGYEKLTEVRTFPQVTTLINRIDWLGSFANEVPFILAAVWFALRGRRETHRRIVRWVWPVWMYVSVTGVVIYVMLYQL